PTANTAALITATRTPAATYAPLAVPIRPPPASTAIPFFFFYSSRHHRHLHSFPTRRSSDLSSSAHRTRSRLRTTSPPRWLTSSTDRKSTRLNSSHVSISYAVFCLKKKKEEASRSKPCRRLPPYPVTAAAPTHYALNSVALLA